FAFSSFVMRGLTSVSPANGVAAMQAINVAAVTPAFMTTLFGTAAVCLTLAVVALTDLGDPAAPWLLAGAALYIVGVIGTTVAYTVPRNDGLARLAPDSADAAPRWPSWVTDWTAGNHVRVVAGVAATASYTVALSLG